MMNRLRLRKLNLNHQNNTFIKSFYLNQICQLHHTFFQTSRLLSINTIITSKERNVIYAEERSSTTQFELGQMFRKAPEESRDYDQAAQWFQHSAEQGYRKAQYKLGLMYARGLGVNCDYVQAYAWLKIAATQGSKRAFSGLNKYASRIPSYRIEEAHALSRDYYEKYVAPFAT